MSGGTKTGGKRESRIAGTWMERKWRGGRTKDEEKIG